MWKDAINSRLDDYIMCHGEKKIYYPFGLMFQAYEIPSNREEKWLRQKFSQVFAIGMLFGLVNITLMSLSGSMFGLLFIVFTIIFPLWAYKGFYSKILKWKKFK